MDVGDKVTVDLGEDFKDGKTKLTGTIVKKEGSSSYVVDLGKIKCVEGQVEKIE